MVLKIEHEETQEVGEKEEEIPIEGKSSKGSNWDCDHGDCTLP